MTRKFDLSFRVLTPIVFTVLAILVAIKRHPKTPSNPDGDQIVPVPDSPIYSQD
jgi:hypothetical protein